MSLFGSKSKSPLLARLRELLRLPHRLRATIKYRIVRELQSAVWPLAYPFFPRLYPKCTIARVYWSNGMTNFGDILTPWVLSHYGIACIHASIRDAQVIGIGSHIQKVPFLWSGLIWGAGLIEAEECDFPKATIVGLRGRLTQGLLGSPEVKFLGDPGLLVGRFVEQGRKEWDVGLIPHFFHKNDQWFNQAAKDSSVKLIDVERQPQRVVAEISSCKAIVTSSLHGLIIADSFGIPSVWVTREPSLIGNEFKFLDYESVVTPGWSRFYEVNGHETLAEVCSAAKTIDPIILKECQDAMVRSIGDLKKALRRPESPVFAWGALVAQLIRHQVRS